jgi:hypothetical protein
VTGNLLRKRGGMPKDLEWRAILTQVLTSQYMSHDILP